MFFDKKGTSINFIYMDFLAFFVETYLKIGLSFVGNVYKICKVIKKTVRRSKHDDLYLKLLDRKEVISEILKGTLVLSQYYSFNNWPPTVRKLKTSVSDTYWRVLAAWRRNDMSRG